MTGTEGSRGFVKINISSIFLLLLAGCSSLLKEKETPPENAVALVGKPLPPDQAQELLSDMGEGILYGQGLGDTIINGGTVFLFPPYALLLVGNLALSLTGYEPITVSRMLPENLGNVWSDAYDGVASGPGRAVAAVAGEEYRTREVNRENVNKYLKPAEKIGSTGGVQEERSTKGE
jgi:hypothetical protein